MSEFTKSDLVRFHLEFLLVCIISPCKLVLLRAVGMNIKM